MNDKTLNITNGDYFNEYFKHKFGGLAFPFCEVMMDGEVVSNIYSQEFVIFRAKSLNVTENEYRLKMYVHEALRCNNYQKICLWFGKDTFCQMNLLTVLAYLEQIEYRGEIKLNYIDDQTFEVLDSNIDVKLGIYKKIFDDVFILKKVPEEVGLLIPKAIDLFFDYCSGDGELVKLIRDNINKEKKELISFLLKQTTEYGLSDLQIERLINSYLLSLNNK